MVEPSSSVWDFKAKVPRSTRWPSRSTTMETASGSARAREKDKSLSV